MESHIIVAIIALALIMVSANPVPQDQKRQGSVVVVQMKEPTPVGVPVADRRQDGPDARPRPSGFMSLPPSYTNPLFSGKMPFEYISGPYESNSVYGQPFQGGPFGGLGVPLSNGPLGGVMSIPLLALMNMG